MKLRCYLILTLLLTTCIGSAFGQAVNATLLGTVTDITGAALPNAKVTITEVNTHVSHTGSANASGNYEFPNIPPGLYTVAVEVEGFKKEVRENIHVEVDTHTRTDVQLQPGNVNETIEVTGAPPVLQTDRADTGRTIDQEVIEELPLGVNRNFQSLLDLAPGTSPASFQHSQFFNASSSLQTESNGQPRMGNNLQIEGVDNNMRTGLLQILIPPAEAIQSVSISTSNHDPELGRASGAVSNVILKSGTNIFHGGAYWLDQNSAFDARAFFVPKNGHIAYNRVGGNIGGPIRHNRIFFFTDYLRTMDHENNTNIVTIPSVPFRAGNLSAGKNQVYDPTTGTQNSAGTSVSGRTPFPGNIIPASRINPIAAKIESFWPAPNQPFVESAPSNNYFALLPAQKSNDQMDVKIDNNLTDKDRLSGRFSFSDPHNYQASIFGDAGGPAQGAFQGTGWQRTYSAGLSYNRTVSPTLLTEIRLGIAHYHNEALQTDYGKNDTAALGIPGVNVNAFTSGFVGVQISDFTNPLTGYSASLPWVRAEANVDVVNSWTKILHNHTLKWGADLHRIRDDLLQDQTFSPRGVIDFQGVNPTFSSGAPGGTGVANYFASFLLDVPNQVARDLNTYFPALRAWQLFAYAADNWQVTPRTTINLGVRWEFYPPPTPAFPGGFSNYDFKNNQLIVAGVGGNPMNMGMQTRYHYFAPRIGVARRLTNTTVIRAGFGMSYTPFPDNTWAYNYPVRANNVYNNNANSYLPAKYPDGSIASFEKGFPALVPVPIPANGIIRNPDPTSDYVIIPLDWKNPYVETWNFAVQQSLPFHFVLDVAYVANHGVDTPLVFDLNAGQIPGAGSKGQPQYPRTATSKEYFAGFSSTYNSLQVKFDRRFSAGLKVTTSFTWGKALSFQTGDDGTPKFYYAFRRNYARTDWDRTLSLVQSYIYPLPFGHGKALLPTGLGSKILGGWQISGVWQARTGTPLFFSDGGNLSLPGTSQTPNQIGPIHILHGINIGNPWFSNTNATFQTPPGSTLGNMGRNELSGPGMFILNASLARQFLVKERYRVDLRLESFNATNTPWFANPQTSHTSSTFGYVTSTTSTGFGVNGVGGGRSAQIAMKVTF
jgi:hypothetical protein